MKTFFTVLLGAFFALTSMAFAQNPSVTTGEATNRTETSATLNGDVRLTNEFPFGRILFEYGRTDQYGTRTSARNVTESQSFEADISGLRTDRTYHFRAILVASDGRVLTGADRTFITTPDNIESPPTDFNGAIEDRDQDGDGVSDGEECPGIASSSTQCPDSDNDGTPDYLDTDSDNDGIADGVDEQRTSPANGSERNNLYTDFRNNSCSTGEARALYGPATVQSGAVNPGSLGDDLTVVAVRGAFLGYGCPETAEEIRSESSGNDNETEGTVVDPAGGTTTGAGGLISNNNGTGANPLPEGDYNPGQIVPCTNNCDYNDFIKLIQNVIQYLIYLTVLIIVVAIIKAGWKIIVKGDTATARSEGKELLKKSVFALVLVLFSFTIVNTILTILTDEETTTQFIQ